MTHMYGPAVRCTGTGRLRRRLRQLIARRQRPRLPSDPPRRATVVAQRPHAMDMITRAICPDAAPAGQVCPVNSHNEWDPLEEVIVGRLEGAVIPSGHPVVTCNIPGMAARAQSLLAGCRYPKIMIEPAQRELDRAEVHSILSPAERG